MSPRPAFLLSLVLVGASCTQTTPPKPKQEVCGNSVDDDMDGKTDCADPECFNAGICQRIPEDCRNTIDDNGDGRADCDDAVCVADPSYGWTLTTIMIQAVPLALALMAAVRFSKHRLCPITRSSMISMGTATDQARSNSASQLAS